MDVFKIIGRENALFDADIEVLENVLSESIKGSKILVIGSAGSIGRSITLELFKRDPGVLHAVDISENNLVELVRIIRSSLGYGTGEFKTFAIDCAGVEFEALYLSEGPYDYIFNLSALKHVRSEKDPYTLMRLIQTNIFNTLSILKIVKPSKLQKYFCVSTDKATNPVNMMGASKKIMEQYLMRESLDQKISLAHFANVAFSDGSLLHGFSQRLSTRQPISAPSDVRRYFITPQESGELCMLSGVFGENREIFFPKLNSELQLEYFSVIAERFLEECGYEPYHCDSEEEARREMKDLWKKKKWPVYFFESDTTGEKSFEEFYTENEIINFDRFDGIGVISNTVEFDEQKLDHFENAIADMRKQYFWEKQDIVELFEQMVPEFIHEEKNKYLDERM